MGFLSVKHWHAFCDVCGEHVFVPDSNREGLAAAIRAEGWSYSAKTRRTLCPRCRCGRACRRDSLGRWL